VPLLPPILVRAAEGLRVLRAGGTRSTRFALSVLTGFLLVSGTTLLLLYALSSRVLVRETVALNRALLEQASRSMDSSLLQLDSFVQQLAIDPYLANVPDFHHRGDYATLLRINEDLNNLRIINSRVVSVEVYFRSTREVFIPNTGVLGFSSAPDQAFLRAVDRGTIPEGWQPSRTIHDAQADRDVAVVSVVKFLRQGSVQPDAFLVVNIAEDFLRNLVGGQQEAQGAELLITDSTGGVVARLAGSGTFEGLRENPDFIAALGTGDASLTLRTGTRLLVTVVRGSLQEWRYVSILPYSAITAPIRFLGTWSLIVILAGLLASLAVVLFFSRRLNALLRQVLARAASGESPAEQADPLSAIESRLVSLRAQTRELERSMEAHLPVLRNNALESLFKGRLAGGEALRETLRSYGLSLGERQMYVTLLASLSEDRRAGEPSGADRAAVHVIETIRRAVPAAHELAAVFTRDDEIAILVGMDETADRLAEAVYRRLGERADSPDDTPVALGMSAAHEGIDAAPAAYREARLAARAAVAAARPLVRFEELSLGDQRAAESPFDREADLIDAVTKGDARAGERAYAAFEQAIAGKAGSFYSFHLLGSLLTASHDLGLPAAEVFGDANPWLALPAAIENGRASRFFRDAYARMLEKLRQRKASRNRQAAERIAAHVRAHCAGDLSLHALSRLVFMSGPYLSRIFHEEMGVPLKQFIGSVRLARAQDLLRDASLKVADVGRMVGYDKQRGFLKFFKEQARMTPLEYRAAISLAATEAGARR
jgi:AraC-like DNA-binding protein